MSDPLSLQILEALQTRLEAIEPENGYNTDAGARVFLGRRRANPDEIDIGPVLHIYDTEDEVDETTATTRENIHITLTVVVDGLIRDLDKESTRLLHLLIQDIKMAMLSTTDLTIGGLSLDIGYAGRTVEYPEPGGDTIGVSLEFSVLYAEPYGAP